jgi:hypothetical protein
LKRAITIKNTRPRKNDVRRVLVGVFGREGPLAHLVELGTAAHRIKAGAGKVISFVVGYKRVFATVVQHPGARANPFLRVAADVKAHDAIDAIGDSLGKGVEKEALKLGKRR